MHTVTRAGVVRARTAAINELKALVLTASDDFRQLKAKREQLLVAIQEKTHTHKFERLEATFAAVIRTAANGVDPATTPQSQETTDAE